jgi:hypothetical protein
LKEVHEEYERQRQEDKDLIQQQMADLKAKDSKKTQEMAEIRAMIMAISMNKQEKADETNSSNQGSTPKRPKRRTVSTTPTRQELSPLTGTTLEEEFPEELLLLEGSRTDEEPSYPEEGLDTT